MTWKLTPNHLLTIKPAPNHLLTPNHHLTMISKPVLPPGQFEKTDFYLKEVETGAVHLQTFLERLAERVLTFATGASKME